MTRKGAWKSAATGRFVSNTYAKRYPKICYWHKFGKRRKRKLYDWFAQ